MPETDPGPRRAEAERVWRDRSQRTFTIDAPLPRSPWWLMPSPGDAIVDFPWGRKRVLTYAFSAGDPEDVNLFDRDRRFQICTYPSGGRAPRYSDDDRRVVDVLDNDITARFDPERLEVLATHTMRVKMLSPSSTLRLRLNDDFRVASVTTAEGGNLLFFRVRDQGTLVVSLGPLARREEPFTLTTRYAGRHDPAPIDQELVQVAAPSSSYVEDAFVDQPPFVYSNRTAWYPRPPNEDFATARVRIESPSGWLGVTGGELVSLRTEGGRTRAEYRLEQPGKFVTVIVGRLADVGLRQEGEQAVRGFAGPRMRGETLGQMLDAQEMLAFYAERFGPSPYPDSRPRGGGGRDSRRPQPARARLPSAAPAGAARALAPRGSFELQRPARLLPGARDGSPVVGRRARPRRTTASAGSPRPGRSTPRRCGCASGSGRGPSAR